ncbi:MAG: hypothetical protein QG608_1360 [Actinomycetota bacterium]|nr:hypothetical protein [Actinomycetota bacterium]
MLTRLRVDGFKNLLDFDMEFGPYTCLAGPNAAGKSNIFDAIEFLSLLADHPFAEAAHGLRAAGLPSGDPEALFWQSGSESATRLRLATEMLVAPEVEDDFGRRGEPTARFLSYEVELEHVSSPDGGPSAPGAHVPGPLRLVSEDLRCFSRKETIRRLPAPLRGKPFLDAVLKTKNRAPFISTETDGAGARVVAVHQDGGSRGKPRVSPARRAPRTVISTTTTIDDPTILAARREMQQWRLLALEPSAMRAPDSMTSPSTIATNGAHLAAALTRMVREQSPDVLAAVAAEAAALTDVRQIAVDVDPRRDLLTLQARIGSDPLLPARALPDGTLRFLALCVIALDDTYAGLICLEEPENGIHPGRIEAMADLVRDLALDPAAPPGLDNPFRQVVVNTHSPAFVRLQNPQDILLARPTTLQRNGTLATTVRAVPLADTWRAKDAPMVTSTAEISDSLTILALS